MVLKNVKTRLFQNGYSMDISSFYHITDVKLIKPYSPYVTFLHPLKTSENRRFSDVFRGYRNVTLGEYGLISLLTKAIGVEFYNRIDLLIYLLQSIQSTLKFIYETDQHFVIVVIVVFLIKRILLLQTSFYIDIQFLCRISFQQQQVILI